MQVANARLSDSSGGRAAAHAQRHAALYGGIWDADPSYGTRASDVQDTVDHRIGPHIARTLGGFARLVVDFGAGDGRFLAMLCARGLATRGLGVDLYRPQTLPAGVAWRQQALWEPVDASAEYAISTDTLEHMPPDMVPAVIANIHAAAPHGFLRISTRQDIYGTERGLHLHETVEPPEWWLARLSAFDLHSWRVYPGHAIEVWY